jgi:hypothetical protein
MTTVDSSISWAVLAPLPAPELRELAEREWRREFPHATDPPPWDTVAGRREYNALVSRSPGTEGGDRHFAEILSTRTDKTVYSLWLDPERQAIFAWDGGRAASQEGDPLPLAASLGFAVDEPEPTAKDSVAVVEGASVDDVRAVLPDESWINLAAGPSGVVITAADGPLGTQAWDVAEALPDATVYFVHQMPGQFTVLLLRGTEELGRFHFPRLDDDTAQLDDVKGATTPATIRAALGIERP